MNGRLVSLKINTVFFQPPTFFTKLKQATQTREQDMPVTTGALPIDEWTRYLEQGDEQLAGSGWGAIEMRGIDYVPASLLPQ